MSSPSNRFRKISNQTSIRAKKSLGQNFLMDRNVIARIIDACQLSTDEDVLEIGPGTGALTREIASRVKHLTVIETDYSLIDRLKEEFKTVNIIHADFLRYDLKKFIEQGNRFKIVGNLPYYISTPIITKIIEHRHLVTDFYLTIQQELAQRIVASPGSKEYGSLSCFTQYYAEPVILFKIKNSSFKPIPKVDSCFLRLTMRPVPAIVCNNEGFLFQIIRLGFQQRRKTLINALSSLMPKEQLNKVFSLLGLDANLRAEQLSLKDYVHLSHLIRSH